MELEAEVDFLGSRAHYAVSRETNGVYNARLVRYDGPSGVTPPERITLVYGVRRWVGSYDEPYLVQELGNVIEGRVRDGGDPSSTP